MTTITINKVQDTPLLLGHKVDFKGHLLEWQDKQCSVLLWCPN